MNRLIVHRICILLMFVVLVGRLYQLQIGDHETNKLRNSTGGLSNAFLKTRPQRGEVFAADGQTLLSESVPIFTAAIRPSALPVEDPKLLRSDEPRRALVYAELGQILGITSTLTISPAAALDRSPLLKNDLLQGLGAPALASAQPVIDADGMPLPALALAVPPTKSMLALKLRDVYSDTLSLSSPISDRVNRHDVPGYETVVIKRDIPRDIALVLRENANNLPGVVIERDWSRRYPLSGAVPTLSHLLGYVGRIDQCALVRNNTARTWVSGMLDSIGHAVECGVISKQIDSRQIMPRYLADDRIGKDGVEASYENELRGTLGVSSLVIDASGRPVEAPTTLQAANDGDNIVLTIDAGFQKQVEQILQNWITIADQRRQKFSGVFDFKHNYPPIKSGVAIVTEIKTGRILAMVSLPSYDNNLWVEASRSAELDAILNPPQQAITETQRLSVLYNRATAFTYPPGSTLKQFDAVIALHKGVIKPDTQVYDAGKLLVQNRYNPNIKDPYVNANSKPNQWLDVYKALEVSSNVFFMSVMGGNKEQVVNLTPEQQTIEQGVGIDSFKDGLAAFGFGASTGIRLPEEDKGVVPSPAWKSQAMHEEFTTGDLYNMAIGQGNMRATPLQLAMGSAAIASNGKLFQPQIVDRIVKSDGTLVKKIEPVLTADALAKIGASPADFAVVRAGMRRSVTNGPNIAARAECSNLQIAGKTGTAEFGQPMIVPNTNGKGTRAVLRSHAWFAGFAPYDDPQIEVVALIEGAGDMGNGSAELTVPVVTQIMQAYFNTQPLNPLPRGCQADMPPIPARQNYLPVQPAQAIRPDQRGR